MNRNQFPFNCYEVLGVSFKASPQEIKNGWKKVCMKAHPDLGGTHNEQVKVNNAKDTLLDPVTRIAHDIVWNAKRQQRTKSNNFSSKNSSSKYAQTSSFDHKWQQRKTAANDPLGAVKRRFYEETEVNKEKLKKDLGNRADRNKKSFTEEFKEGKRLIGKSLLYGIGFSFAGFAMLPVLYIGTAINAIVFLSNIYGVKIKSKRFSVFDYNVHKKINDYAQKHAEISCEQEIEEIDRKWELLASISDLLLRKSSLDDSEQQVARRIAASFFLMGYRPQHYYQDNRIFTFLDGDEKLVVRFRHRRGQATNINYVKTLHSSMRAFGASKGVLFCSPGLSGNAAHYAKQYGISSYSLEKMNDWVKSVLTSDYDGPTGDLRDGLEELNRFMSRISAPLPYRRNYYRRKYR